MRIHVWQSTVIAMLRSVVLLNSCHPATPLLFQVYIVELMAPLLQCMYSLSTTDTLVLLAYYERSRSASEAFWTLLPQFFRYEKIPEETFDMVPQPAEVGIFKLQKLS